MENSNEVNILNEIKIVDNIGDDNNLPDLELETQEKVQKISVIIDNVSESKNCNSDNNNINNQETSNTNNDNPSTYQSPKDDQKTFHITSSHSLDNTEKILKDNNDSHIIIEEENKDNLQDSHFISENKSIDKKNLLSKKLIDDEISSRKPYSMTDLELKDGVDLSNKDVSTNEYNSCDQLHPPKTKRPSTNFIKHITGFSELTYKSKSKNKGTISSKDENKNETPTRKKSNNTKKLVIQSDSNILGNTYNEIVNEKKNFKMMLDNFDEIDYKRRYKITDDNPAHTRSFQGFNNYKRNILSSSYLTDTEMNSYISKTHSRSMPASINFHNYNPVMNPENVDIIDHNYESVKSNNNNNNNNNINTDINNLFNTESNSNGNINYNDFLFDDEQDNNGTDSPTTPGKEVKKKAKINNKNVTFIDSENSYIPNLYKKDNAEERQYFCNNCKKNVDISIKREYTTTLWVLFAILLICGLIFAWIPFLFKRFKYYSFYCKVCKKRVIKLQQDEE